MSNEDDTYSTMFTALKHPIRRKILRILNQTPATYTDLQTQLGIDNGLLNYHLDNLRELINKEEDGKYRLSDFGEAAQLLTTRVESPVKRIASSATFSHRTMKALALGLVCILLLSNVYLVYTIQSQSNEKANAIGASLIQTRGLIVEPVNTFDTIASSKDLGSADLYTLYGNLQQAGSKCDSLSKLDLEHTGYWTQMSEALMYLSGFTMQLSQQTSHELTIGSSNSTSLSWLEVDCIAKIREDLVVILNAFPWDVTTGSSPHYRVDGQLLSVAADASSKLVSDIKYARSAFHLGEPGTLIFADGSYSAPPSGVFNVTIKEVNGTFLFVTNSSGTTR